MNSSGIGGTSSEPRLDGRDSGAWQAWQRAAAAHARTRLYSRHLDAARRHIDAALALGVPACAMWSGGKDSTVLVHLLRGCGVDVISEKDDLDYPGEREYVVARAADWGLRLRIVTPAVSPREWMMQQAGELQADDDMHSRSAGLSRTCFYELMEEASTPYGLLFLGLRAEESRGRNMNRSTHGVLYRKLDGKWISNPLSDWHGIDVYAYAAANGIELLPVYRCIGLMHATEPWRVRKSWWIPGKATRHGGATWLQHYYPSLFRQLAEWCPDVWMKW